MTLTRQQRRARDRQHGRQHRLLFEHGLPAGDDTRPMAVLVHHLAAILGKSRDRRRASEAAAVAQRVFEISITNHPPERPVECAKGCSFCCHNSVGATIPEALLLARRIGEAEENKSRATRARVHEENAATRGKDQYERVRMMSPCPLLVDNACSFYEFRPLACRGFSSHSVDLCRQSFGDPMIGIPTSRVHTHFRSKCAVAMWAALKGAGLPHVSYELTEALAIALETDDAEARWLSGEDVFAGAQVDPTRDPQTESLVDRLIAEALG